MGVEGGQERIAKLEEKIDSLWNKIIEMASNMAVMTTKLEGLIKDVEEIKATPKKRWDSVVSGIIAALVTAFVAYLIGKASGKIM